MGQGNAGVPQAVRSQVRRQSFGNQHLLDDWLRMAYERAKLTPQRGGLWHPFRRKWASERKGHPVVDVAAAGGWKDVRTVQNSYQQVDARRFGTWSSTRFNGSSGGCRRGYSQQG